MIYFEYLLLFAACFLIQYLIVVYGMERHAKWEGLVYALFAGISIGLVLSFGWTQVIGIILMWIFGNGFARILVEKLFNNQ